MIYSIMKDEYGNTGCPACIGMSDLVDSKIVGSQELEDIKNLISLSGEMTTSIEQLLYVYSFLDSGKEAGSQKYFSEEIKNTMIRPALYLGYGVIVISDFPKLEGNHHKDMLNKIIEFMKETPFQQFFDTKIRPNICGFILSYKETGVTNYKIYDNLWYGGRSDSINISHFEDRFLNNIQNEKIIAAIKKQLGEILTKFSKS